MKLKVVLLTLLVLLIILIVMLVPSRTALVFYEKNTDNMEAFLPIKKGETFQVIFTHSIHLTDVVEKYRVTDDLTIEQYEIVYEKFGIGMPSNAEEGATFEYKDGKYHITDLNNIFPSMKIRNGKTVSKNRLVWGAENSEEGNMVWFNKYFEPGAWFTILVEKISLWEYVKGVKISE
ncbi:DUF1850 domain-containing protein [Aquibacillus sp. 3ASR75-11]|uniref:DUF1850 domain-containing protein n=1 Tax=Terrihalobacillus insolitus TaxID=2950438 RepID=A0A9X3WQ87_9BACI|nr:DUF1850 domain-containing protein [Terrihalobacillus insolitus]MDC3414017.1 DUF1850 domain-containing protein [Terrihalobacillus insolitus]MDC3424107.1 DUF1850 domain-containing protein [Terrihalobacillus insolitus]